MKKRSIVCFIILFVLLITGCQPASKAPSLDFKDVTFTVFREDPKPLTSLRSLASSSSQNALYGGYIRDNPKGVYKIDIETKEQLWHFQEEDFGYDKGVAVDSRGNVFVGNTTSAQEGSVMIYILDDQNGQLKESLEVSIVGQVGINGVAISERDGKVYLYFVANYGVSRLYCYDVTDIQNIVPSKEFGNDEGYIDLKLLSENNKIEGNYLKVLDDGEIYMTANLGNGSKGDAVLKITSKGDEIKKVAEVSEAYGIDIKNGYIFVSTYLDNQSSVEVLSLEDYQKVASIGNMGDNTYYSAVTIVNGRIYIADQGYNEGSRILVSNEIEGLK